MQIKYIQSLYHKKFRDEYGTFVVEGPKIVKEFLLSAPGLIETVFGTETWLEENKLLLKKLAASLQVQVSETELKKMSALSTPNQVLAVVRKKQLPAVGDPAGKLSLILDGIQDPGNMGTLIRIADWFGVENIFCSPDCADPYNPKVVQASMGSLIRVSLFEPDLPLLLQQYPQIPLFTAMLDGESIYGLPPVREGFLMIGNESKGIRPEWSAIASRKISIPRRGRAESLNAAVAAGIILSFLLKPLT